jgi:hypothetical protein
VPGSTDDHRSQSVLLVGSNPTPGFQPACIRRRHASHHSVVDRERERAATGSYSNIPSVADEVHEPSEPSSGSQPEADRGETTEGVRASLSRGLEEIAARLEQAQAAAAAEAERQVAMTAGQRLGEAISEFRATAQQIAAEFSRDLEQRTESLIARFDEHVSDDLEQRGPRPSDPTRTLIEEHLRAGFEEARRDLRDTLRAELEARFADRERPEAPPPGARAPLPGPGYEAWHFERVHRETDEALDSIREAEKRATSAIQSAIERVTDAAEAAAARAQASVTSVSARVESAAQELTRRSRRQELKLLREERSQRTEAALRSVDDRVAAARRELEQVAEELQRDLTHSARVAEARLKDQVASARAEREQSERSAAESLQRLEAARESAAASAQNASAAEGRMVTAESRAREADARVEQAMAQIDQAVGRAQQAEDRLTSGEERMRAMERRMKDIAETVARAGELEGRMWTAVRVEEEVARRIREAERRILGLAQEPPDPAKR